jgi:hypothetical protein
MDLLATASVAIDGSKFKAVNNRHKHFTRAKVERRRAQRRCWKGKPLELRSRSAPFDKSVAVRQAAIPDNRQVFCEACRFRIVN